jgi:hypothetical protein
MVSDKAMQGGAPLQADEDPQALETEIAELTAQREHCEARAKELMQREAAGEGVFAKEIFELKQRKQMLNTEIQHCRVRLNLWRLGQV